MNKLISSSEFELQCALRVWMSYQYPRVLMRCSMSGVRLSLGLAKKMKRLNPVRGWPDILILEPREKYHGLAIELKKSRADLYTKKGKLKKTQHLKEQAQMLSCLKERGYFACFAFGFEETQQEIRRYLEKKLVV